MGHCAVGKVWSSHKTKLEIRTGNCLPAVQTETADLVQQSVKAVETKSKKEGMMLIRGSEGTYVD
jgi:hypothetical protein